MSAPHDLTASRDRCEVLREHLEEAPFVLLYTSVGLFSGRPLVAEALSAHAPYVTLADAKLMTWANLETTNDVGQVRIFTSDVLGFSSGEAPLAKERE